MEQKMTLLWNGVEKQLDFESFWYQKFFGQKLGVDPITQTVILNNPEKQFDYVCAIIYAGLMTDYKVRKVTIDFTYPQVEDWVGCMSKKAIVKFIADYTAVTKNLESETETVGEKQPQ